MTQIRGKVAVVTGAGSGIGRALACDLARRGARLAISDVDTVGLAETAKQVRVIGAEVHQTRLDVTDRAAVLRYADEIAAELGTVNIVINNAGIAFSGDVEQMSFEQIARVMDVDFWGVVNGTKAFLPHVIASGDGHIVNISSLFGLLAMPGQSAYNAAKFAVRGFTEALREEMLINGHPVQVTCVHPGGIKTAIARNAGAVDGQDAAALAELFDKKLATTSAESAAKSILRAVIGNRPRAVVGWDAKVLDILVRISGPGYQRVVALLARRIVPTGTAASTPGAGVGRVNGKHKASV
jgi:short-subunit dehydrogenase